MALSELKPFVIENGHNTCYIDSLFMALFYVTSQIDHIFLNCDPDVPSKEILQSYYLQELIKIKFVENIRKHNSIDVTIMNELRNNLYNLGWKNGNIEELMEQQDVNELYVYLIEKLKCTMIEIQRTTISGALPSESDIGRIEKIPFIPLVLPLNKNKVRIKDLLSDWLNNNPVEIKRHIFENGELKTIDVQGLNIIRIKNTPTIMPLSIVRFTNSTTRLHTHVDIQKKIIPLRDHEDIFFSTLEWEIHAIICHKGNTIKSGHYYCLLSVMDKWYIFDDLMVPCLKQVSMDDPKIIEEIGSECVFLIYKASC